MPPENIPAMFQYWYPNSLVNAVLQAELLLTLEGPGPFTLFAPTDQAFVEAGIDLAALDTLQVRQHCKIFYSTTWFLKKYQQ